MHATAHELAGLVRRLLRGLAARESGAGGDAPLDAPAMSYRERMLPCQGCGTWLRILATAAVPRSAIRCWGCL